MQLTCPHCQSQFSFAAVPPGTPVRCRTCKQSFSTPQNEGFSVTPENIFGPAANRAATAAPAAASAPASVPAPVPQPTPVAKPAPAPVALPPAPIPAPAPAPSPAPFFTRQSTPTAKPVAAAMERPLPKSMRGPLEAETAHVCPQCGLTSVSQRGGGPPAWASHVVGIGALTSLYVTMPGLAGLAIGLALWALAFVVFNILWRTSAGFKCSTCGHAWE